MKIKQCNDDVKVFCNNNHDLKVLQSFCKFERYEKITVISDDIYFKILNCNETRFNKYILMFNDIIYDYNR